ncbi:hypothetical protein VN97_g4103 [Penicillium thymicola]|uniref:Uncharacterized protein n=1 Tax=Penicillium thymicola TaxID=293382 RepID=A0AAI9TL77_PENTH|nr:hypothetical protein VN97_g4103 [Penicillium thymicola]
MVPPLLPLYKRISERHPPISSHGLVVKRMTSNHEILGSTPSVSIFWPSFHYFQEIALYSHWTEFLHLLGPHRWW